MVLAEGEKTGFSWRGLTVQSPGIVVTRALVQGGARKSKEC